MAGAHEEGGRPFERCGVVTKEVEERKLDASALKVGKLWFTYIIMEDIIL
jgi:hypothetical protein